MLTHRENIFKKMKIIVVFFLICSTFKSMKGKFKVNWYIIGNREGVSATAFSRSPMSAIKKAESAAWNSYEASNNTNYADSWVTIVNPYGKQVFAGFEGDLSK